MLNPIKVSVESLYFNIPLNPGMLVSMAISPGVGSNGDALFGIFSVASPKSAAVKIGSCDPRKFSDPEPDVNVLLTELIVDIKLS
jgi:hypothetical protein